MNVELIADALHHLADVLVAELAGPVEVVDAVKVKASNFDMSSPGEAPKEEKVVPISENLSTPPAEDLLPQEPQSQPEVQYTRQDVLDLHGEWATKRNDAGLVMKGVLDKLGIERLSTAPDERMGEIYAAAWEAYHAG